MKGLVEDMLTLARADEQRACGEGAGTGRVELSTLVDGCALEFDAVAFERGCSIESRLEPGLAVTGDASQLGRLVRTLLDNATKYAAAGSAVRVSLAREGRAARLAVTNLGDPIAPEDLEHLFDRFYRTDRARGAPAPGRVRARPGHRAQHRGGARRHHLCHLLGRGRDHLHRRPPPRVMAT